MRNTARSPEISTGSYAGNAGGMGVTKILYLDYALYLQKYHDAQNRLNRVLSEREELFGRTQPTATDYGKDRVSGTPDAAPFDAYLIAKEKTRIDERILEAQEIVKDREKLLKIKERELRASRDTHDRIYCMRELDKWAAHRIAGRIGYSTAQIYRIINIIEDRCKAVSR